jgi:hypothetical protein
MLERLNTQNAYEMFLFYRLKLFDFFSLNRATLHELERDAQDKFRARVLDSAAHNTKTTSRGINFYEGIENIDNTYVKKCIILEYSLNEVYSDHFLFNVSIASDLPKGK